MVWAFEIQPSIPQNFKIPGETGVEEGDGGTRVKCFFSVLVIDLKLILSHDC